MDSAAFDRTGNTFLSGYYIALLFLSIGSLLFFRLFYRSRYVPRTLAGFGVAGSVLAIALSVSRLVFVEYAGTLQYALVPLGLTEIAAGFWLLIRGLRPVAPLPSHAGA